MSGDRKKVYVAMRRSGAIMQFRDGLSGDRNSSAGPYTSILNTIANEMGSAGGDYDAPIKLFLDGELVVPDKLNSLAWEYSRDEVAAREQARRAVNAKHRPSWCDEDDSWTSDARGWEVTQPALAKATKDPSNG